MHTILAISDSDKHFKTAIDEYSKRLWKWLKIHDLKPFKDSNPDLVIQKDTETIKDILEKKYPHAKKILLSKEGSLITTEAFAKKINHQEVVFIIWWPYGLNEELLAPIIHFKLSFGKMTLPHGLAKLNLVEQLYRSHTLAIGKKYHY